MSIPEAKASLYHLLISSDPENLTESEIDLMAALAKDDDIQEILRRKGG
jgi:hypothetical protein